MIDEISKSTSTDEQTQCTRQRAAISRGGDAARVAGRPRRSLRLAEGQAAAAGGSQSGGRGVSQDALTQPARARATAGHGVSSAVGWSWQTVLPLRKTGKASKLPPPGRTRRPLSASASVSDTVIRPWPWPFSIRLLSPGDLATVQLPPLYFVLALASPSRHVTTPPSVIQLAPGLAPCILCLTHLCL